MNRATSRCLNKVLNLAIVIMLGATFVWSQDGNAAGTPSLNMAQVVEAMQRHDQAQAKELQHYQAVRHYAVVYRGFAKTITAGMEVEVVYDAGSGKRFRILSQNGSAMLCQKVLKRALDSEREASLERSANALTPTNYKFAPLGTERLGDRTAYVLNVEPIKPSKFLYKGRIWVDAADFAVAKMEVQPAQNPSFWISRTLIHHSNMRTGGFWLPERNQSESKVRIGGTATMTIEYGTYQIVPQAGASKSASVPGNR